jgi:hypothetical protein
VKFVIYAFLLNVAVILPACAADDLPKVEVVITEPVWQFSQIRVSEQDSIMIVSGRMNTHSHVGLPSGHVDIAVWSPKDELIAETTTNHSPILLTRGELQREGVRFLATLSGAIPRDAIIKIAFHRDPPKTKVVPAHFETVAR